MLLARIKQLREELNIQQRQMADAIGVDAPMYSRIERGIRPFRDEYIAPMAKILKIDKDELRSLWTADKIINVTNIVEKPFMINMIKTTLNVTFQYPLW